METTDVRERNNVSPVRSLDCAWFRALLGQGQMRSRGVIVGHIRASLDAKAEPLGEGAGGSQLDPARIYPSTWQGYLVDLPAPPPTVLLEEVRSLRAQMIERRDVLDNRVGASKLTVPEVLVAIALPGGSAYLIGKTARRMRAQKALSDVTTDLAFLDEDLLAFQGLSRVYVIALEQGY